MEIGNGIGILESSMKVMGGVDVVYPTLLWDKDTVILVDAGFGGTEGILKIREQMLEVGVTFERISKVIITHQDLDHIGGLPGILKDAQQKIDVLSHEGEKPYIQGDLPLIKFTVEAMKQLESLPEEWRNTMKRVFENPPKAKIDKVVVDGEELPYCGGIVIIHTPGHTPGHICLYHKQSKTLIAGDALRIEEGQLMGPNPRHSFDIKLAIKSLTKLMEYDIEQVICYHGGMYKGDVKQRIEELIKEAE